MSEPFRVKRGDFTEAELECSCGQQVEEGEMVVLMPWPAERISLRHFCCSFGGRAMASVETLRPCIYCRTGKGSLHSGEGIFQVRCDCGGRGPNALSAEDAIVRWNLAADPRIE